MKSEFDFLGINTNPGSYILIQETTVTTTETYAHKAALAR